MQQTQTVIIHYSKTSATWKFNVQVEISVNSVMIFHYNLVTLGFLVTVICQYFFYRFTEKHAAHGWCSFCWICLHTFHCMHKMHVQCNAGTATWSEDGVPQKQKAFWQCLSCQKVKPVSQNCSQWPTSAVYCSSSVTSADKTALLSLLVAGKSDIWQFQQANRQMSDFQSRNQATGSDIGAVIFKHNFLLS